MRTKANEFKIYINGKTLRDIERETGISYDTLYARYARGNRTYDEIAVDTDAAKYIEATGRGKRLLDEFQKNGVSTVQAAERSGVSYQTIWRFIYQNGDTMSSKLARVCAATGASMDYVMGVR